MSAREALIFALALAVAWGEVFVLYGPGVMLTVQMGEPVPDSLSNDPTPLH
ncbi:MAG: hypothetical protein WAK55_17195 [Xanthobacteraceae bacterium]